MSIIKTPSSASYIRTDANTLRDKFGVPYWFGVFDDAYSCDVFAIYANDNESDVTFTVINCDGELDGTVTLNFNDQHADMDEIEFELRHAMYPYDDEPDYCETIASAVLITPNEFNNVVVPDTSNEI